MMDAATRHLILDALWRGRIAWFFGGAFLVITWALVAVSFAPAKAGIAASLIAVFVLGPVTSLAAVMAKENRFLPLTSRDVWVAAWVVSTVVATSFVVLLQAAGMGIGLVAGFTQPHAVQSLSFVALCTLAYGGALLPVGPLLGYTAHAATERRPKWLWAAFAMLMLVAYSGGLVVPWAAWSWLPSSFADLTWASATLLLVGVVAAGAALAWTPSRFGGMSPVTSTQASPAAGTRPAALPADRADRLTGVSRLLLPTLAWVFAFAVVAAGGAAVYVNRFMPTESLDQAFAAWGLLPFSAAGLSAKSIFGTAMIVPFLAIGTTTAWDGYTRHLRVLPQSAADTTRLLLTTSTLMWALVWGVLLGIHVLVLGVRPSTLQPEFFVYLVGLSTLLQTAHRTRKKSGLFTFRAGSVILLVVLTDNLSGRFGPTVMFWTHVIAGSVALLIAATVTYRALTRSPSSAQIYQPSISPFNA
jgi:hypothetical protein